MPAFLTGFEFDFFISYGWAGAERPDEGDRGWVSQFSQKLCTEMRARLGGRCELFFDAYAERNGFLYKNLAKSLASSGAMLFIESPGSCRPDSWCRFELCHFFDEAQPVAHPGIPREERLFKLVLRKVDPPEPEPLAKYVPYAFSEPRYNSPLPTSELEQRGTAAYDAFQQLCLDLEKLLKRAKKLQESSQAFSGKTVFLGAVPGELAERRDRQLNSLESRGHRVVLATAMPNEPIDALQRRSEDAISRAHISVHLFGTAAQYDPSALQCRLALESNVSKVYIWRDRDVRFDPGHEQFLTQIQQRYLNTGRVEFPQGGADSYLDPNLGFDLARREQPVAPPPPPPGGRSVMLQFSNKDQENIRSIVEHLQAKGFEIRPPLFAGNRREREELHAQFYRDAAGIVVFFGSADDLWTFRTCTAVSSTPGVELNRKPAALILAPPCDKPPSKSLFRFPLFQVIDCSNQDWTLALDRWVERMTGGGDGD